MDQICAQLIVSGFSKKALMIVIIITRIFDNRHHYSDHLQCHKTSLVRQESIEGIGQNQPEMGM